MSTIGEVKQQAGVIKDQIDQARGLIDQARTLLGQQAVEVARVFADSSVDDLREVLAFRLNSSEGDLDTALANSGIVVDQLEAFILYA